MRVSEPLKINVKLPVFEIKKFTGDPEEWISFNESFNAAVDSNKQLSNIQYLQGFLSGEAEETLKGLRLTNDNYETARKMLSERFGDKQILISHHMTQLLETSVCMDIENVKELRKLYDRIESQIRNLETLGLDQNQYGPMLTPVLISKLPSELRLIISRNSEKLKR